MLAVDWHSEEHVSWLCEQAGIEFKGLPLAPYDRLRLMAIIEKNPPNKIPTFKKTYKEATMSFGSSNTKPVVPAVVTEKMLLDQYDQDITKLKANQDKYARLMREAREEEKALTKKRASLAKLLGITLTCLAFTLSGCSYRTNAAISGYGQTSREQCDHFCAGAGGTTASVFGSEHYGYACECSVH